MSDDMKRWKHTGEGYGLRWGELFRSFEALITEDYGPRCPDVEGGCACCQIWAVYDLVRASVCVDNEFDETNPKDYPT